VGVPLTFVACLAILVSVVWQIAVR